MNPNKDLIQPEFSGLEWLRPGVLPQGEALIDRINALLPHEIIGEKSAHALSNPRLVHYINTIFHREQLKALYFHFNSRIPSIFITALQYLDGRSPDVLEACIKIIERSSGYDELPSFEKLRLLYDKLRDEEGSNAHEDIGYIVKGKKRMRESVLV